MSNDNHFILADRVSNLEKNIKILIKWLNEISQDVKELEQRVKCDCKC